MSGGSITGNKGAFSGGVIYDGASLGGNFTLSGEARISGNTDAVLNESADISLNRGCIQLVGALSAADTMAVYPYDYNSSGRGAIARGAEGYTLTQTDADKFLPFAGGWGYGFEYANDTLQFVTEKSGAVLPYPYAGVPAGAYKDTISNINLHTDTEDAEIYYQVVNEWPGGPIDPAAFCTEEKKYTGGSTIKISNESPYSMLMLCAKKGEEYSDVGVNQYAFPRIVDMWVSPAGVTALKGDRVAFTGGANCEGGRVRTELSWSVEGATSGDTAIDRFGVLTVGADEAAPSLTVKLTDSVFGAVGTVTARMKASTVVSATQQNGIYGQALPELTKVTENEGTNGVWWILYSGTEDTEYEISETQPTAAGKYIVIADYSSDEYKGYAVAPFVIEKAPLTAKPTDKSIYVGDALPTDFALTYTGLANGDTTAVLTVSGTPEYALKNGETSLENSNTAGDYIIAWSNKEAVEIAADNYTVTKGDGTLTILPRASTGDGGNGGGSGGGGTTPPKPTENPDGSQTTTETDKKTGTVTETTKRPDGSQTVVDTKKDGTVSTTDTRKDGVKTDTVTTPEGNTTATVTVPKDVPKVTVTIPTPEKPKPGEVAVIINADGTKTVVKNSVATEDGMTITLAEGAKLEIIDNSKTFSDVKGSEWYADAVQFTASRELLQGNGTGFAPREHMTRGMLMTVLYRFEGVSVSSGGDKWYSDALAWSKERNLSDGTNPEGDISREQLAVILYRYAGSPKAEDTAMDFADSGNVSAWAADAMDWAVSAKLLRGGDGRLSPQDNATRAEVAAILQRFISNAL